MKKIKAIIVLSLVSLALVVFLILALSGKANELKDFSLSVFMDFLEDNRESVEKRLLSQEDIKELMKKDLPDEALKELNDIKNENPNEIENTFGGIRSKAKGVDKNLTGTFILYSTKKVNDKFSSITNLRLYFESQGKHYVFMISAVAKVNKEYKILGIFGTNLKEITKDEYNKKLSKSK